MAANITYRCMQDKDYAEIIHLAGNMSELSFASFEDETWHCAFIAQNPAMSFIAEVDSKLIGGVYCGQDGRRATVYHLFVVDNYRSKGVGAQLMQLVEQAIKDKGITRGQLMIYADNHRVVDFYKKQGWYTRDNLIMMAKDIID